MNEKGKEYNTNDILIFEAQYSYGKKHGKRKKYDIYAHLIFEGEYELNRKLNGKLNNDKGKIIYELINFLGKEKEYYFEKRYIYEG